MVVGHMVEDASEYQYSAAMELADFPASFSAFLNNEVSCHWMKLVTCLIAFLVVRSCYIEDP
jgi:hypothetical protein